jgi:tight adherence protein B
MQQNPIIIVCLVLLIGAAATVLFLDARQRRMDRQVAAALSQAQSVRTPSIRRAQVESRWLLLHRLANYKAGLAYDWGPSYVLPAAAIAAAAVLYANSFARFPLLLVSPAAALVAVMVVRGLFGLQRRRTADRLFRQLPDAINMVTSAVRTGLPVNEARLLIPLIRIKRP